MTDFWGFLHLEILQFLAQPLVVYLEGPALFSIALPFLICLWIILHIPVGTPQNSPLASRWLILLFLGAITLLISVDSAYWSDRGLHFFSAGEIIWPLLVWFWGPKVFSPWWAYVVSFFEGLISDVLLSGSYSHWTGYFWFGVGGAGWKDAMFIAPLTTCLSAWSVAGIWYAWSHIKEGNQFWSGKEKV